MTDTPSVISVQEIEYLDRTFQICTLPDRRRLAFNQYGAPDGTPVFYFHGGPSSRIEGALLHEAAKEYGYRLICPDRPGHGYSDGNARYQIIDLAKDIAELAQYLEIDRFGVIGTSSGGPPVIACAYALADQLEFALALGSAAPIYDDPEALNELGTLDQLSARLGKRLPRWAFISLFGFFMGSIKRAKSPRQYKRVMGPMLCDADITIVDSHPNFLKALTRSIQEAFRQGGGGPADDALAIYNNWGFSLSEVNFPITLIHGTEDKHVPFSFSEYLHAKLPNSTLIPLEGEGHYTHLVKTSQTFDILKEVNLSSQ